MSPRVATEDLLDAQGVADVLGLSHRNTVFQYQRKYEDMPRPVIIWARVESSSGSVRRLSGGPQPSPLVAGLVQSAVLFAEGFVAGTDVNAVLQPKQGFLFVRPPSTWRSSTPDFATAWRPVVKSGVS